MLAVLPQSGEVLGCVMQEPGCRGRPRRQVRRASRRRQRPERETDVWMRLVTHDGALPGRDDQCACRRSWRRSVSVLQRRAKPRRRIFWCERSKTDALSQKREDKGICEGAVRAWKARAGRPFEVPASHGRTARSTQVQLAFGSLTVLPPREDQTLRQRTSEGAGRPGLGRADAGWRRAVGMDSGDLGPHHDA